MNLKIRNGILGALLLGGIAITGPVASALADDATPSATPDAYGGQVVKTVLVENDADASAPGETLSLTRYTIPAGAKLPVHMHPGIQMATVESGELTYHVVEGELLVNRADGTQETYKSGSTVVFIEGDSWEEPEGMVHFAENLTAEPVVLLSTALLESDMPATILVDATPVAATPAG